MDTISAQEYLSYVETAPKKKNEHPEHELQVACWDDWQAIKSPGWFATGRDLATKSAGEGERKKKMGCIAGLSDLEFWLPTGDPRRRLHAEAKFAKSFAEAEKNLTDSQKAMRPIYAAHGEAFDLFWSVQSFRDMLTRHGIPWVQPRHAMTAEQRDIKLASRRIPGAKKPRTGSAKPARPSRRAQNFAAAVYTQ